MFRDEHSAACCEQAVALCLPSFIKLWYSSLGNRHGRLLFTCFAICGRVTVERQGLLEEVNEETREPQDQRSVILTLEESCL